MLILKEMTVTEAVRTAKEVSGKSKKEIADALGISRGVVTRYLKEDDDYSPRMGMTPDLCHALENDIILQWMEVYIREDRERRKEKMVLHVAKMEKAFMGIKLLLAMEEGMSVEDEEELYDLSDKIKRECQRLDHLLPRTGYKDVPGEKSAGRAAGTMRQARHNRKR